MANFIFHLSSAVTFLLNGGHAAASAAAQFAVGVKNTKQLIIFHSKQQQQLISPSGPSAPATRLKLSMKI